MSRSGQWFASLLLAAFGVGLAAIAMEVGVRALHLVPDRFWQYDEVLGTRLIAGKEGWWTQEDHEFVVPVRINSLGLRDHERVLAKPAGVERVLLVGDSHVEALQVPLEESVGPQLEERLRGVGGDVEVVSAGVSGYGTAGELLLFRNLGWKFDPDLVLLAFYPGNDVKNNSPLLEKALVPEYSADGALLRIAGSKPRPGGKSWIGRSAAYRYMRKLILTRQPRIAALLVKLHLMKSTAIRTEDAPEGVPLDYWVYADPPAPEWADAWLYTERLLDDFRGAVADRGARFAVMIVPARDVVDAKSWAALQQIYPQMKTATWNPEMPTARILEWCRTRDVACLNLAPIFRLARDGGSTPLHFVHDGHWTAAGHALAAEAAAEFIGVETLL